MNKQNGNLQIPIDISNNSIEKEYFTLQYTPTSVRITFSQRPTSHLTTSVYTHFASFTETSGLYYDETTSAIKDVIQTHVNYSTTADSVGATAYRTETSTRVSFSINSFYVISTARFSSTYSIAFTRDTNSYATFIVDTDVQVENLGDIITPNVTLYHYRITLSNYTMPNGIFGASISGTSHNMTHTRINARSAFPISSTPFTLQNIPTSYNKIIDF